MINIVVVPRMGLRGPGEIVVLNAPSYGEITFFLCWCV
jgi:hypothetical protein